MSDSLTVRGAEQIPPRGPVLITCNHPGIFDAMAIFASLPRTDVKVIARPRTLLDVLPNVRRHIIFVTDDPAGGTATLRESLRHLAEGGLLVTFPRGRIEPDPLLHPEAAIESVAEWSSSVDLLAKHSSRPDRDPGGGRRHGFNPRPCELAGSALSDRG